MSDIYNSETFWLIATNIILGLVTVICLVAVGGAVFKEVLSRLAARSRVPLAEDTHAFNLADLGITMADGGTRIDEVKKNERFTGDDLSDPGNIVRSVN